MIISLGSPSRLLALLVTHCLNINNFTIAVALSSVLITSSTKYNAASLMSFTVRIRVPVGAGYSNPPYRLAWAPVVPLSRTLFVHAFVVLFVTLFW
jgi:hypothetical protein